MRKCIAVFLLLGVSLRAQPVTIPLQTVGSPGNAADITGYGSVPYQFQISTYDVTISQYAAFLNSVATYSDPYGLYNSNMVNMGNSSGASVSASVLAGITRTGASGSYYYAVLGASGGDPVTWVTWLDAARFCNWLQNGELAITGSAGETTATTEAGAYALNGDTSSGLESRSTNASWVIPGENEWYKAAYYDPNYGGTGAGGYWSYATRSNSAPGNTIGGGSNEANYLASNGTQYTYSATQSGTYSPGQNYLTACGSFTASDSAYATFDQGGDVNQWNESILGGSRGVRGGYWSSLPSSLNSSSRGSSLPTTATYSTGFRVAEIPEPSACVFAIAGLMGVAAMLRRRGGMPVPIPEPAAQPARSWAPSSSRGAAEPRR